MFTVEFVRQTLISANYIKNKSFLNIRKNFNLIHNEIKLKLTTTMRYHSLTFIFTKAQKFQNTLYRRCYEEIPFHPLKLSHVFFFFNILIGV